MARALLRLWALAELAMTLLYAGQLQALWGLPGAVPAPGRADDEPAPDPHDADVALPRVRPVGLEHDPDLDLADRPQPEGLEVAEVLAHAADGLARAGAAHAHPFVAAARAAAPRCADLAPP